MVREGTNHGVGVGVEAMGTQSSRKPWCVPSRIEINPFTYKIHRFLFLFGCWFVKARTMAWVWVSKPWARVTEGLPRSPGACLHAPIQITSQDASGRYPPYFRYFATRLFCFTLRLFFFMCRWVHHTCFI
jgi:hypothetical protein